MVEKWTGKLIGRMHNEGIDAADLAAEMGISAAYVSMILNGKRKPPDAKIKMEYALDLLIKKRKASEGK